MPCSLSSFVRLAALVAVTAAPSWLAAAQDAPDPEILLQRADTLAWRKDWPQAMPLFAEARRLFEARGDVRNALYAEINTVRGDRRNRPVAEASQRLAEYLDHPLMQQDEQLRLRTLVIKAETDVNLDPVVARHSWTVVFDLATQLGESAWANRAHGELGLVAFLLGDISGSVVRLGEALQVAQTTGDAASVVRWLTLFGHGYIQMGRPDEALGFYDRALAAGGRIPDLEFPVMTFLGKGQALNALGRFEEAGDVLRQALAAAREREELGFEAELLTAVSHIARERGDVARALTILSQAADLARRAGGGRLVAEVALDLARIERVSGDLDSAAQTLDEGITAARRMQEHILLPRLLAELADLRSSQQQYVAAADLLDEANDILEGLFTSASTPWTQSRLSAGMDEVFTARIRLEIARGPDASRLFSVIEHARSRSLLELLVNTPLADVESPAELRAGEKRIAALQVELLQTTDRDRRKELVDEIFFAEQRLAPASAAFFEQSRRDDVRPSIRLLDLQRVLTPDEVFLEFMLAEPMSYAIAVTQTTVEVRPLLGRDALRREVDPFMAALAAGESLTDRAQRLGMAVLGPVTELATRSRLVVSPDGDLHQVPFDLLVGSSGAPLIESHIVSYVPSGSVLTVLRQRGDRAPPARRALAVSASMADAVTLPASIGAVERGVYDLDGAELRPLPAANDEAQAVATALGASRSTVLVGEAATEQNVKQQALSEYQVVHFATHGIPSERFPARAALLMHPGGDDDGVLQAREILQLRLAADLVTLSACDTASGSLHGQDGVLSLVRPFLAAGAGAVVANLWTADDSLSLSLMRAFYRELATGTDIAAALRRAKLSLIEMFGPAAAPHFWSGVVVFGDGAASLATTD